MKSLVVYSSQTGNTKKLADAVYDTLTGEKEIHPMADDPDPNDYDVVAVGFWLQAGKPDPKTAEYLPKIAGGQRLFLFATHGAAAGSDHAQNAMAQAQSLAPSATLAGMFSCQGEVNPKVIEKVSAKPEPPVWIKDAPAASGHPDEADIEQLKQAVASL